MRVTFDHYILDTDGHQLLHGGEPMHLTPKAFDLLAVLISEAPRAVSRRDLHDRIWPDTFVTDTNLAGLIAELRSALGDDARRPRFIRTVQRFGYAFSCDLRRDQGRTPKAWLTSDGAELPLFGGRNIIGRDRAADVRLDHPSVSRRHATIAIFDQDVSKNGTSIASTPVQGVVPLSDRASIVFGSVEARFHFQQSSDSSTLTTKR